MTSLHDDLDARTAVPRARLLASPFFRARDDGSLPPVAAVTWRRCLALVNAVLGRSLARCGEPAVAALAELAVVQVELDETTPSIGPAIDHALVCGSEILATDDQPLALAGALFALARDEAALAPRLATLVVDAASAERAAIAAERCTLALERIAAALLPFDEASLVHHIAAINVEAGDHAMPQDPLEIALALRAGHAAWLAYPYLEARFGERGKRFTRSDSCWLVALASMPATAATKSLHWLRTVLAPRGIPTVILESHLHAIAAARTGELGRGSAAYQPFLDGLAAERTARPGWAAAIAPAEAALAACPGQRVPSAARLVASSWLDERCGIAGALAATRGWLVDPARFSGAWIAAIDALVARLDEVATC